MRPLDQLRKATREVHDRLEATPYARAVLDGTLNLTQYVSFLRALHVMHTALESTIEASGRADLRDVFGVPAARRELLERDLTFLRVDLRAVDAAVLQGLV